jgi:6-pyruvoyltetrahydropterin/6-carboxytetrahydropterin synthase
LKDPLAELAPRLAGLADGGYDRRYRHKGKLMKTSTHQLVAELLDSLDIPYREGVKVGGGGGVVADFIVNGTLVFVERALSEPQAKRLSEQGRRSVMISRDRFRSDAADHGVRVVKVGDPGGVQTIFIDDPSFNFDYAHILPKTAKCSVMHGHTSAVLVEVVGRPVDGMVVDFGIAKDVVRESLAALDHKLFIDRKYIEKSDRNSVTLRFRTVHGPFTITAPRKTTVLLHGEATVENLAREVVSIILPRMPDNVTGVGAYVYEGLNKGSHILAHVHREGVEPRSKR